MSKMKKKDEKTNLPTMYYIENGRISNTTTFKKFGMILGPPEIIGDPAPHMTPIVFYT